MDIKFTDSFLWGAAISSYQCEGGNFNADWCTWEKKEGLEEALLACDHYNLFNNDFELAKKINLNSLRISIEWSRICPDQYTFLEEEIDHYLRVIDSLIKNNLKPVVTLHHFTNPIWFADKGGWSDHKNIDYFIIYLRKITEALKDKVDTWLIFNEPLVYIYNGYIHGIWPPGEKSIKLAVKALNNIIKAYMIGYKEIKTIYKDTFVIPKISLTKNIRVFSGCDKGNFGLNSFAAFIRSNCFNFWLFNYLNKKKCLDFIGLNFYCKEYTKFKFPLGSECKNQHHKERQNGLDWFISPQGFYDVLIKLKKYKLPVIVMENGTSESDESYYEEYLIKHLKSLAQAINDGVDVVGYFWWSLLDNFEWDQGRKGRFGLIEVDYNTMKRKIRPFANTYGKICIQNRLSVK
ncbi:MAG: glycoside hydrolase family 1 protein [Candidatus Omnitrophica bacterium]|nr:glycoside hydrolase family 1 protein [Candidatus Omnitrophota bacterium]